MLLSLPLPLAFVEGRGYSGVGAAPGTLINPFNGTVIRAAGSGNIRPSGPSLPFYGNAKFGSEAAGSLIKSTTIGPWSLLIRAAIVQGVMGWVNFAKFLQGLQDLSPFQRPSTGNETASGLVTRPRTERNRGGRVAALLNPPAPTIKIPSEPIGYTTNYRQTGYLSLTGQTLVAGKIEIRFQRSQPNPYVEGQTPYVLDPNGQTYTVSSIFEFETNLGPWRAWSRPGAFNGNNTEVGIRSDSYLGRAPESRLLSASYGNLPVGVGLEMRYIPSNPGEPSYPVPQRSPEVEFEGLTIARTTNNIAAATATGQEIKPSPPSPTPAYLPKYAPAAVPDAEPVLVPAADPPVTPRPTTVETQTIPKPLPVPVPPTTPTPEKVPIKTTPTDPAGNPVPVPVPTPTPTPTDQHLVDGQPFTPGNPRADLQSIANEVGRIENKMAAVLKSPIQQGNFLEDLVNLLSLLELILEILDSGEDGGSFTLSSPCVLDEYDQRIESEVYHDGGRILNRLESKVNALAELLQVHKDLAQPGCDGSVPSGNVTVTFTEVV